MNEYDTIQLQERIYLLEEKIRKLEDWVRNREYQEMVQEKLKDEKHVR